MGTESSSGAAVDAGGTSGATDVRSRSAVREAPGAAWSAWRGPLAVWLVVMVVAGVAISYGLSTEQARIEDAFEVRTEAAADAVAGAVASRQELLAARAVDLLAGAEVSVGALRSVVLGMGFESGAVFDERGRYVTSTRFREEEVGRDFSDVLEHVRIAATEGRAAVSQAVVSPSLGTAAVGVAAPYPTPYGTRIVTGVLTVQGGMLDNLLADDLALGHVHADVVDREGVLVASVRQHPPEQLTPYEQWAPEAAAALRDAPSGAYVDATGVPHLYRSAEVAGTGWQLVLAGDESEIMAHLHQERTVALWLYSGFGLLGLVAAGVTGRNLRRRRVAEERVRSLNRDLEAIVERRTAALEEALRRSREGEQAAARLARVVESAGEAIIGLDLDGTITSWNPAAAALYGYSAEEAVGQPITLLTDPEYAAEPLTLLRRVGNGESVVRHLTVRRGRDGGSRQVRVSIAPVLGPDGKVDGVASLHMDVTRQSAAERASRHALELFETIFRSGAPQGVTTLDGQFIEVNDALCDLLGYERERLLTMRVGEVTDATDRETTRAYMQEFRDGTRNQLQLRKGFVHRDGRIIPVLAQLTLLRDADGEPEAVIGILQDVSAQTEAEQRLSQREALLEGMTSSSANISTMYDTAGRCVFAAGAGLASVGESPETMVGSYFVQRHGENPEMMDGFRRTLQGESVDLVVQFRGHWFDIRLRPVSVGTGVSHVALSATDITDRQRVQFAVELSERRFRALVQHANDAILQVDEHGRVLDASAGVEPLTGETPDSVIGRSVLELVAPDDHDRMRAGLAQIKSSQTARGTATVLHTSGSVRAVDYEAVDLRGDEAVGSIVVTLHDVTERVRLDLERSRHAAELEAVNKDLEVALRVRDHILAATTHELRTPLTPMVGLLELISARWDDLDRDELWRYLEVLHRNTDRLTGLVEDLLFATGLRSGTVTASPEAVPVTAAVRKSLGRFPETAETPVPELDVSVWCTPDHLNQILNALVSNAVKYGRPVYGAAIDVGLRTVTISISDHGDGIPDDLLDTLFEPFMQGSTGDMRTATRLGLGLPIARALAEANGGSLAHRPGPGGGSTFVVVLPRDEEAATATEATTLSGMLA